MVGTPSCVPNCAQGTDTQVTTTITLLVARAGHFTQIVESRNGLTSDGSYGSEASWPLGASAQTSSGTGSSSGNGVASKTPTEILAAAQQAASSLTSVHISGAAKASGVPLDLDLTLSNEGGEGTISENGLSFQVRSIGQSLYINASPAFWTKYGGGAAATLFAGKWLKTSQSGQFSSLGALTSKQAIFGQMLTQHHQIVRGGVSTVDGQTVIALIDKSKNGGTLYVATTGKPYPVEVTNSGGAIEFDRFNQPVTIAVPANSVDLSQLK